LLDYQNNGNIGKPSGNDIKEKKLTLPIIFALEQSSLVEKKKILSLIKRHNKNKQKVRQVIDFVIAKGGLDYAAQRMNEYKKKALDLLEDMPDNEAKNALIELVNYVVTRKK